MSLYLSIEQMAMAASLVVVAMAISTWLRLGLTQNLFVGAIRACIQLTIMGYVLVFVFESTNFALIVLLLLFMIGLAAQTASARQRSSPFDRRRVGLYAFLSILLSTAITLSFITQVVVQIDPWYSPQYWVPLGGMVIANSMNAAALGAERFFSEMASRRFEVETLPAMGANPRQACASLYRRAVGAAMMPTVSSMMVVGLVSIPGMMSGQILSGVSPLLAIRYQLVVQFMIAASAAITASSLVMFYGRSFFDSSSESLHLHRLLGR